MKKEKTVIGDLEFHEASADEIAGAKKNVVELKKPSLGVSISKPYVFNITNTNAPEPVVVFDAINDEGESVTNVMLPGSFQDIKKEISENPVLIGRIRIDFGDNSSIGDIAIGFRRTINGDVVEKKFIAPFFLAMNQYISNMANLDMDLPLDGKTEVLVYTPNEQRVRLYLFPYDSYSLGDSVSNDELFLKAISSASLYDDCIKVTNETDAKQNAVLKFTEDGVCCDNKSLKVSSSETYLPDDKIYFRKLFGNNSQITSVIYNGDLGQIIPFLRLNSFQTTVIDIEGRREVNKEKVITIALAPQQNFCLFVLKNKKPLYNNGLYVSNYSDIEFNSASEVRAVLAQINKQKLKLELLLEKNDFVIKES